MEIKIHLFCAVAVAIFSISSSQSIAVTIPDLENITTEPIDTTRQTEAPDSTTPEVCKTHNECKGSERCRNGQCSDECQDIWCGDHGNCLIKNHTPTCDFIHHSVSDGEYCDEDEDCEDDEQCNNEICTNMCESHKCGLNEQCTMVEHKPVCIHSVAVSSRFGETNCTSNDDCEDFEKCDNSTCIDACYPDPCGAGAMCGRYHHKTICICDHNTTIAPETECVKMLECFSDDECSYTEECRETKCQDPCAFNPCGDNALCAGVYFHAAVCICEEGFTGNPYIGCSVKTPEN